MRMFYDTGFNSAGTVSDVTEFMNAVALPTQAAVDTPLPQPPMPSDVITPETGGGFRLIPKEDAPAAQPEPKPIFEADADQETEKPKGKTSEAETVEEVVFEDLQHMRNYLQGKILAWFAGNSRNGTRYMLDDAAMNMLLRAYKPYANTLKGKIPAWIMVFAVELAVMMPLIEQAREDRDANKRNKKAIQDANKAAAIQQPAPVQTMQGAVSNIVPFQSSPPAPVANSNLQRTRFKIHADGSYCYGREGAYYNKGEGEKVNLQNTDEVKAVIRANGYRKGWERLQKAFNLPDSFLITTGIGANLENVE